jgi:4-hydroxymandelate oxidase
MDLEQIFAVDEFEELARAAMDPGAFAYYYGGAEQEITLRENIAAFDRYRLRPRVLRGLSEVDTGSTLLDAEVSLPIGLAPTALHKLAHPDGECAVARAAGKYGALQIVATYSSYTLEEVAEAASGPLWFQLYMNADRSITEDLISRAGEAGYGAIVLTVDLATPGYRTREYRNWFVPPPEVGPANFTVGEGAIHSSVSELVANLTGDGYSWSIVEWLRELTELPIVLKGIMTAEDAALALEHGADALIVSNHGGRQLDRSPASIDVLGEVVEAVEGQIEVYLDGGIRRGTDVLIARALGARAVFIGRPYLWGLAAAGADGVARVLDILQTQLVNGMLNLGVASLDEVTREHLA